MAETRIEILSAYLPPGSIEPVIRLIMRYSFELRITRKRSSKFGDYRPPQHGKPHRISVNHDLNPYAFLLTFIHEVAHLVVHEQYARRRPPHGAEWKAAYRELLEPFYMLNVFPEDIRAALNDYFRLRGEGNRSDLELNMALKLYDQPNGLVHVRDLPHLALFRAQNGRVFRKGNQLRKRFRCQCLDNKRAYLVPPLMEVYPVHYQYALEFPE